MSLNDTTNDADLARILQERMITQSYNGSAGSPPMQQAPVQQQPSIVYVHESPNTYNVASQGSFSSPAAPPPQVQQQPQVTHVLRQSHGQIPPPQMDSQLRSDMHSQLSNQYASMAPKPREDTQADATLALTLQTMEIEDANRQSTRRSSQRSRTQVHHHHHQTHQPGQQQQYPQPGQQQQQQYPGTYPQNQAHPQYRREIPYGTMPHRDQVRPAKV